MGQKIFLQTISSLTALVLFLNAPAATAATATGPAATTRTAAPLEATTVVAAAKARAPSDASGLPKSMDVRFYRRPFQRTAELDPISPRDFVSLSCPLGITRYQGPTVHLKFSTGDIYSLRQTPGNGLPQLDKEHVLLGKSCPATSFVGLYQLDLVFEKVQTSNISPALMPQHLVLRVRPETGALAIEETFADEAVSIGHGTVTHSYPQL